MLVEVSEQLLGIALQRGEQPQERGQPDLPHAPLDARNLDRRQAGSFGEILLGPPHLRPRGSEVAPELLDGFHRGIVLAQNQKVQNQPGMNPPIG